MLDRIVTLLLAFCLGGVMVSGLWHQLGFFDPPEPVVRYARRPLLPADTVFVERPVERIIYERVTDTVHVRIPVPDSPGFQLGGVIPRRPVTQRGRSLVLTYWQPDSLMWIQDVYAPPVKRWGYDVSIEAVMGLDAMAFRVRAEGRYRNLYAFAETGPLVNPSATGEPVLRYSSSIGVGARLFGR